MIGLKEAYEKIKKAHPNKYTNIANEYPECYRFVLVTNGIRPEDELWGCVEGTQVDKDTGKITENVSLDHRRPIRQYPKEELERL